MKEDNDEITVREVGTKIKMFVLSILTKWPVLLITGLLCAVTGFLIASFIRPSYTAKLTFVLSTETKAGGLSGLANQFGFDIGGSTGNDIFSGDNILSLFKSGKMVNAVLFKKAPEKNENLINIIAKEWELDDEWKEDSRTENAYPFPTDFKKITPVQDSLVREVQSQIIEDHLTVTRLDKKLSVYEVNTTASNEVFACYLTKYLMDETADFYINTKTSMSKKNLKMLQHEADSLKFLLGRNITTTAASVDRTFNLNTALQVERAVTQKSQVNSTVVAAAYGEVIKNLELAKITLQKETPLYQIIDEPKLPLKVSKVSKTLAIVLGFFAGVLISAIVIVFRRSVAH
jgi:uncharacterized protein involved in exopolysaccharide biosynthesis